MDDRLLQILVRKYQGGSREMCRYVWHGGEPTIAGLDFYRRAMDYQDRYRDSPAQRIKNSMQSNGWLINSEWVDLLKVHDFDLGISLDGPAQLNDAQRGDGYFRKTMRTIRLLQEAGIPFSTICVVTSATVAHADELFDFFVGAGFRRLSFNPIFGSHPGYDLAPMEFSRFLERSYDRWVELDDPDLDIRFLKESVLGMLGGAINLCMMQSGCRNHLIVEHDGRILPCHSYAEDTTAVGHLEADEFETVGQHSYFRPVQSLVDENCSSCRWYSLCGGDCVRFIDPDGELGKRSFCSARKDIFSHIEGHLMEAGFLEAEYHGEGRRHPHLQASAGSCGSSQPRPTPAGTFIPIESLTVIRR
jgi:uncharacterized protein